MAGSAFVERLRYRVLKSNAAPYANPVHDHITANNGRLSDNYGAAISGTTGTNHASGADYGIGFTGFDGHGGRESCDCQGCSENFTHDWNSIV
jgi:hypothetical protein